MQRIGLALSGGGFRATLFHLGLIRFLRDAGSLSKVTHITSVSGGSIIAAHLVLNWERYNGSPEQFDAAAAELLSFVDLDVRNRITRRFPLSLPLRWPRRLFRLSNRKLTRTGLLEYHYERYLYGDISLFELPEWPQLHILATNLSEGCLCSFTRDGLLMVRRQAGKSPRLDHVRTGLATVPMAVTASSAFPGFFPPLQLTAAEVGSAAGDFGRQAYTDGGVFDNLGVRMFGSLERSLLAERPFTREDFFDLPVLLRALREAGNSSTETPLRRLAQILSEAGVGAGESEERVLTGLWGAVCDHQLQREPLFAGLALPDDEAASFLDARRHSGGGLDRIDQRWLNRHLLDAAFRLSTGRACLRRLNSGLDGVIVSDVGKRFEVEENQRTGGVIRTMLRATDILMDRVWQLESETFEGVGGFVFAQISEVVEPSEDATALHPEIQRSASNIRTDLDVFSPLEVSSLVRHGYCVARKMCRQRPDLFGADLPGGPPWDPIPVESGAAPAPSATGAADGTSKEPAAATVIARKLRDSANRRIWRTLLSRHDWTSYVYLPLVLAILLVGPYLGAKYYARSQRLTELIQSFSQGSPDLARMNDLLEDTQLPWPGVASEEVPALAPSDDSGFDILQDTRIIDLRTWKPINPARSDPASQAYVYRRVKVLKRSDSPANNLFNIEILANGASTAVRFPSQQLQATLRRSNMDSTARGGRGIRWQASYDLHQIPVGDFVDLLVEYHSPGPNLRGNENSTTFVFPISAETGELATWILMPKGREYRDFRIVRYPTGRPEQVQAVRVVSEYLATDKTVIAFKLLSLDMGWTYEIDWSYE